MHPRFQGEGSDWKSDPSLFLNLYDRDLGQLIQIARPRCVLSRGCGRRFPGFVDEIKKLDAHVKLEGIASGQRIQAKTIFDELQNRSVIGQEHARQNFA